MLKMRLQRIGRKNSPSFRVIVTDSRQGPKSGKHIDSIGTYNPKTGEIQIDGDKAKTWIGNGVQVSDTVHNMLVDKKVIEGKKVNVLPKKSPIVSEKEAEVADQAADGGTDETASEQAADELKPSEDNATEEAKAEEAKAETEVADESKAEATEASASAEETEPPSDNPEDTNKDTKEKENEEAKEDSAPAEEKEAPADSTDGEEDEQKTEEQKEETSNEAKDEEDKK